MPNYVTNEIKIIGPETRVAEFFKQAKATVTSEDFTTKALTTEEVEFSFRGFVPPPDHPDYNTDGCSHRHPSPGMAEYIKKQFGVDMPTDHPMLKGINDVDEHPNCWYVWNKENWGTKWDAGDVKIGGEHTILDRLARAGSEVVEEVVQFDTAWSPPFPVFNKITELYPDCRFVFRWIDEDMQGHGGGQIDTKDGKLIDEVNDPDDPETGKLWWQLARDLKGYSQDQHDDYLAEVAEEERLTAEAESA